jgi:DNA-binding LacI/PurR family transcriptional regulator
VDSVADQRLHGIWRSAFLGRTQDLYPEQPTVPVHRNAGEDLPGFKRWLAEFSPDVLITHALPVEEWLKHLKLRIPTDIGLITLGVPPRQQENAGINLRTAQVGREALNLIVNQIHLNERGVPPNRVTVLIEPQWVMGETVKSAS